MMKKKRQLYKTPFLLLFLSMTLIGCTHFTEPLASKRTINLERDFPFIYDEECPPPLKLTIQEIIQIALEKNFELAIKEQEMAVQSKVILREQLKMLPRLVANAEWSIRNNELIVSSESVDPTVPPAPPSISTERHVNRYDINLIFNLLDFGLAYLKSEQESKRIILQALEYEQARQALILDIYKQYWRAVSFKIAMDESGGILYEAEELLSKINRQMQDRFISKPKGLRLEVDLSRLQVQLSGFADEYDSAMSELALLMGLAPNQYFEIIYMDDRPTVDELPEICSLEKIALLQRPELYGKDVEEEITLDQIHYAFLQMLPGIELFAGDFYDSNKYFRYNNWVIAGIRATWNLLSLPAQYYDRQSYIKQRELVRLKRVALSIGVLSQVRLAYILYQDNFDQYQTIHIAENISQQLLLASEEALREGAISKIDVLFIKADALAAKINALKAYSELQISLEKINYAIGVPNYIGLEKCDGE